MASRAALDICPQIAHGQTGLVVADGVSRVRQVDVRENHEPALVLRGWAGMLGGWILLGSSLAILLEALNGFALPFGPTLATSIVAAGLAVVGGFLALIPGGLGVRELIAVQVLAAEHSTGLALVAVALWRITSIVAEGALSVILYLGSSRRPPTAAAAQALPTPTLPTPTPTRQDPQVPH